MKRYGAVLMFVLALTAGIIYMRLNIVLFSVPTPHLPPDQWWGDNERPEDWQDYLSRSNEVATNRIFYSNETIQSIWQQLGEPLRLIEPLEGTDFQCSFQGKLLQDIIDYWRDDYLPRWREREIFLWQFNHFTTEIQGLRMHFLHLMAYDEDKVGKHHYPVLLLHGWPSSVRDFYDLIDKLHQTNSDDNNKYIFNVIAPSLPGFAWSQGTSRSGLGPAEIALIMHNLMDRLGYKNYFIHGSDWGSLIGSHMATLFPNNVLGYHSNFCTDFSTKSLLKAAIASWFPTLFAPKGYEDFFFPQLSKIQNLFEVSGYFHLQATKPDTIGIALQSNPIGLAAYILEIFLTWTMGPKCQTTLSIGNLRNHFHLDALLDNIMIYHLTNSITTSQRIYAEAYTCKQLNLKLDRVTTIVPTGCARFRHGPIHFLDFQLKGKYLNLVHSTYYNEGGHFAAMESPNLLYNDFIEFVKKVEVFVK